MRIASLLHNRSFGRGLRHVAFAAIGSLVIGGTVAVARSEESLSPEAQMSLGAAYAGLLFFAATLLVGPVRVWLGKPLPVSSTLRRDLGIWTGVHALMHSGIGLDVHFDGAFWRYFVWPPGSGAPLPLRTDLFGWANWTGLAAALLVIVLLFLSNDASLRRLTAARWKRWQRSAYWAAGLTVLHGWLYQIYERRSPAFVSAMAFIVVAALGAQLLGALKRRGRVSP